MPRFAHIAGAFVVVFATYWTYALLAVPLIEPSARGAGEAKKPIDDADPLAKAAVDEWRDLFPRDAWEVKDPKVLESDQFKVLMQDYQNLGGGRVRINPCTIIYTPAGPDDRADRIARAIVLEAPDGAMLRFNQALDLARLGNVRFLGGELNGRVTMRSRGKAPDHSDSLWVESSDVELGEYDIAAAKTVDFRYGPHSGRGRQMHIHLLPREGGSGSQPGANIGGMEYFEMQSVERLHLDLSRAKTPPAGAAASSPAAGMAAMPVEINCRGPFRFDVVQQTAVFRDQVDVYRIRPAGPGDRLTCDTLSVFFTKKKGRTGAFDLQPQRLEAIGAPAIVSSPADKLYARGETLQYDFPTDQITLGGTGEVLLQQGPNEIHARNLQYRSGPPGHIGQASAAGPGWLRGQMGQPQGAQTNRAGQQIEARWNDQLLLRPQEKNQVLSLTGGAQLKFQAINQLDADEIHFWLVELPQGQGAQPKLQPDRMLARGNVKMNSPQLSGAVDQLEAWFQPAAPGRALGAVAGSPSSASNARQPPAPPNAAPMGVAPNACQTAAPAIAGGTPMPPNAAQPPATSDAAGRDHFEIFGRLLRVKLLLLDQGGSELSELNVDENVRVRQTQASDPSQQPIFISGDHLQVIDANRPGTMVHVLGQPFGQPRGQPAHFEGRGMALTGSNLNLDRGDNRLWIDGPGQMDVLMDRDLQGQQLAAPQPVQIRWQRRMNFDGVKATFAQSVSAVGAAQRLQTDVMDVYLQQPIRFADEKIKQPPPQQQQIEQLNCRGGVLLEEHTLDPQQQLLARERMEVADLAVNRRTGELRASGPGRIIRVGRGDNNPAAGGFFGGLPSAGPARAGNVPPSAAANEKKAAAITCTDVKFQGGVTGNILRRSVTLHDQVRAAYAEVDSWTAVLEGDDPQTLGVGGGFILTSDELEVDDMTPPGAAQRAIELLASGDVVAEGASNGSLFTARASRLTHDEAKDLLILEGDGRTDAQLFRQASAGSVPSTTSARKIFFWRSSGRVDIDGARSLQFNQMPGGSGKRSR